MFSSSNDQSAKWLKNKVSPRCHPTANEVSPEDPFTIYRFYGSSGLAANASPRRMTAGKRSVKSSGLVMPVKSTFFKWEDICNDSRMIDRMD